MSKSRKKRAPKRMLALPDLEQAKSAVLNTLTSVSGQRTYGHAINDFVEWICSEPRLTFRTAVLRNRTYLKQKGYAPKAMPFRRLGWSHRTPPLHVDDGAVRSSSFS